MRTITLLVIGAVVTFSTAALAERADGHKEALKRYCTGDYLNLCSQFEQGSPALNTCFRRNMAKLAPACRTAIRGYTRRKR